ncbi:hypothetical protein LCGC14_2664370, partial [marine sediment metagenome]
KKSRPPMSGKPKLSIIRAQEGNRGHRAIPTEPKVEGGVPSCPSWLSREAKAAWRRTVPSLVDAEIVKRVDRDVLAVYFESWADYHEATRKLQKQGKVVETTRGPRRNPWLIIRREAKETVIRLAMEFGLTPLGRTRLGTFGEEDAGDDLDGFNENLGVEQTRGRVG